ncbi:hypothetical protein KC356_g233 [Hortaea werneckii]|nr:hypothetical protein KC356_g233 [Hortaea werneckii]
MDIFLEPPQSSEMASDFQSRLLHRQVMETRSIVSKVLHVANEQINSFMDTPDKCQQRKSSTWDTVQPRAADLLKEDSKGSFLLTRQQANRRLPKLAMASDPSLENIFDRDQRGGLARLPTLAEPSRLWLGAPVLDTLAAIIPTGPKPLRLGASTGDEGGSKVLGLLTLRGLDQHSQLHCWSAEATKFFNGWVLIFVDDIELLRSDGEDSHRFGRGATIYLPDSENDRAESSRRRSFWFGSMCDPTVSECLLLLIRFPGRVDFQSMVDSSESKTKTANSFGTLILSSRVLETSVNRGIIIRACGLSSQGQCPLWNLCHGSWAPIGSPAHKTFEFVAILAGSESPRTCQCSQSLSVIHRYVSEKLSNVIFIHQSDHASLCNLPELTIQYSPLKPLCDLASSFEHLA